MDYREYSEIYHHGIAGMHWGDRNGPPYPLERTNGWSSSEKRGTYSKDNKKKSSNNSSSFNLKKESKKNEIKKTKNHQLSDMEKYEKMKNRIHKFSKAYKGAVLVAGAGKLAFNIGSTLYGHKKQYGNLKMSKQDMEIITKTLIQKTIRTAPRKVIGAAVSTAAVSAADKAVTSAINKKQKKLSNKNKKNSK